MRTTSASGPPTSETTTTKGGTPTRGAPPLSPRKDSLMLTNIFKGLRHCAFLIPLPLLVATVWLPTSLILTQDLGRAGTVPVVASLILAVLLLLGWLRELAEHGAQARPVDAPCTLSWDTETPSISWHNILICIHIATSNGRRHMSLIHPISAALAALLMIFWTFPGVTLLNVEAPFNILASIHIVLYLREV